MNIKQIIKILLSALKKKSEKEGSKYFLKSTFLTWSHWAVFFWIFSKLQKVYKKYKLNQSKLNPLNPTQLIQISSLQHTSPHTTTQSNDELQYSKATKITTKYSRPY